MDTIRLDQIKEKFKLGVNFPSATGFSYIMGTHPHNDIRPPLYNHFDSSHSGTSLEYCGNFLRIRQNFAYIRSHL